jgi:hypothetical protein
MLQRLWWKRRHLGLVHDLDGLLFGHLRLVQSSSGGRSRTVKASAAASMAAASSAKLLLEGFMGMTCAAQRLEIFKVVGTALRKWDPMINLKHVLQQAIAFATSPPPGRRDPVALPAP